MKRMILTAFAGLLLLTSCQKENIAVNDSSVKLNASDFIDSRATNANASFKQEIGPSNLRAIIRKAANTNQYRLIIKVDSVAVQSYIDANGVPQFKLIAMDDMDAPAKVSAGLALPDPLNPDKEIVVFKEGDLQFTRENENGFYVYKSPLFGAPAGTSAEVVNAYDYELVNISYSITGYLGGQYIKTPGKHTCFILPNGKAIEQAPTLEKTNVVKTNTGDIRNIVMTISGDPAAQIIYAQFVPNPYVADPNNESATINLPPMKFTPSFFNQNTGIVRLEPTQQWNELYGAVSNKPGWTASGVVYLYAAGPTKKGDFMVEDFRFSMNAR